MQPLNKQAVNLITYIKELSQLSKKAVRTHQNYEHVLWVDQFPKEKEITHYIQSDSTDWLTVVKPKQPLDPFVPELLSRWIVINKLEITVLKRIKVEEVYDDSGNVEDVYEELDNNLRIKTDIDKFIEDKWNPFVLEKKRVEPIQKMYDQLFKIYQFLQVNSESYELVAGAGLLTWSNGKEAIQRHLLSTELVLEFHREASKFVVSSPAKGVSYELEEDMLDVNQRLRNADLIKILPLLGDLQDDVWNHDLLKSLLIQISSSYDSQSIFDDTLEVPSNNSSNALVTYSPAFIMRKKSNKSFQKACDEAISQLEMVQSDEQIPSNIINVLLEESLNTESDETSSSSSKNQEFYFPLMANEEQTRIVKSLNSKDNVLVQGPPGTGKTHTIANVTSHLLATGNRVLITSQTAKALSVLKQMLPEELQDLCVSLVGNDRSAFKDLEKVVGVISSKRENFSSNLYNTDISKNETKLKKLKQKLNEIQQKLFEVREQETFKHNLTPRYSGTALEIAKKIQQEYSRYSWYPSNITLETSYEFLLKEKETSLKWFALKNINFEGLEPTYVQYEYPYLGKSLTKESVSKNIQDVIRLKKDLVECGKSSPESLKLINSLSNTYLKNLHEALNEFQSLERRLNITTFPGLSKGVEDVFSGRGYLWESFQKELRSELIILQETVGLFTPTSLQIPEVSLLTLKQFIDDFYLHFKNNGNLGSVLWKPKVLQKHKDIYKAVLYEGQLINSYNQAVAVRGFVQFEIAKERLMNLLANILPNIHTQNELLIRELTELDKQIEIIQQMDIWKNNILSQYEFLHPNDFNKNQWKQLISDIQKQLIINQLNGALAENNRMCEIVANNSSESTHKVYQRMLLAISEFDLIKFIESYNEYQFFQEVISRDKTLESISCKLQKDSPLLLNLLSNNPDSEFWRNAFADWERAVEWRQVYNWLEEFSKRDESKLAKLYNDTEINIKKTIKEIGTSKAWNSMLSKMTNSQNKHLKAWANAVQKIGKRTGKNAARFMVEAQRHMEYCKDAIPAWVMPINRVFENFDIRPNMFDVVIVDEASQSWHDALLLKYIAKKMIIVGDEKQISPSNVGIESAAVIALRKKFLDPINFKFADQLDEKSSFFDMAKVMIGETITLREHFRCMPEIIEFSNKISYSNSRLIPLRQYSANRLAPIKTRFLSNGVREGSPQNARNEVEAEAIVEQIIKCIKNPAYEEKTFGVISLLGSSQSEHIQNLLIAAIGPEEMEKRRIICGDAYAFQGDERDVIFLSMVAAKGETRIKSLVDGKTRQRFNVAVSRAKDQIWLFHSITINDIRNSDCMRYQLLTYMYNPLKEENESNRELCDSQFEKDVFDTLTEKGYKVIPQFNVSNFSIDLVVQGEHARLAVECDGDYWHTTTEDRKKDFHRQRILERAGWTFWRVLGSTYYFNPQRALESLWQMLEAMNIHPYLEWTQDISGKDCSDEEETYDVVSLDSEKIEELNEEIELFVEEKSSTAGDQEKVENYQDKGVKLLKDSQKFASSDAQQLQMELEDISDDLTDFQTNLFTNPQYDYYKQLLRREGFEVLQDQPPSETLYVVGTEHLRRELEYISPKNNSFTFHKDGLPVSSGDPVWALSFESISTAPFIPGLKTVEKQPIATDSELEISNSTVSDGTMQSIRFSSEESVDDMLSQLTQQGIEVLDNRLQTETIWVFGNENLKEPLSKFIPHKIIFRYMRKGNTTTLNRPAWFAKAKK